MWHVVVEGLGLILWAMGSHRRLWSRRCKTRSWFFVVRGHPEVAEVWPSAQVAEFQPAKRTPIPVEGGVGSSCCGGERVLGSLERGGTFSWRVGWRRAGSGQALESSTFRSLM